MESSIVPLDGVIGVRAREAGLDIVCVIPAVSLSAVYPAKPPPPDRRKKMQADFYRVKQFQYQSST
jgi:hypothetical protein